jgi:hypothetical protein
MARKETTHKKLDSYRSTISTIDGKKIEKDYIVKEEKLEDAVLRKRSCKVLSSLG